MSRLVQLAGEARGAGHRAGVAGGRHGPAEVLGDADRAAVLERMESAAKTELARYRELLALVQGPRPLPAHREEFAWVVAALRARLAS